MDGHGASDVGGDALPRRPAGACQHARIPHADHRGFPADRSADCRDARSVRAVRRQGSERRRTRRLPTGAGQRHRQRAQGRPQRDSGDAGPADGRDDPAAAAGADRQQREGRVMTASLSDFHLTRPDTIEEAVAACTKQPGSRYVAGGTDLLVNMRRGITSPDLLVDLAGIDELSAINSDSQGVTIGAGVTIADLARNTMIAGKYCAITQAAEAIAGPGHRNMATVGGNLCLDTRCIYYNQSEWWRSANAYCLKNRGDTCHVAPQGNRCHATFSGDLAPALLVFGAVIDIAGPQSQRRIPLSELYVEDGRAHLALAEDKLVVSVRVPANPPASLYEKVRARGAIDFPLAGVAVALAKSADTIGSLRIALTGTNSRPFLLTDTENFVGRFVDDKLLQEIDRLVQKQVQPMRTTLVSANYRRVAAAAVARRLVSKLSSS